ncbi:UNVERIFIED_CONTAM: hypothetical protein Sangu_2027200 [Sesamum angustifolium]|uniref:Uncharacterized protein n=1 Tax=Sesamum angustifolium TaxID=2727405 RepID=A0AAW2LHW2_9LAMI
MGGGGRGRHIPFSSTREAIQIQIAMALTFPAVSVSCHLLHSQPLLSSISFSYLSLPFSAPQSHCCTWKAALFVSSPYSFKTHSILKRIPRSEVRAFLPNLTQQPILKEALKEPVAFVGGMFAGLLRLDLNEEPLKEWVSRTVEASGMAAEEIRKRDAGEEEEEERPQEIEIE